MRGKQNGGTWAHRLVVYHYAQKLSPQFAVQVSCWLDNLFLTGSVTLGKEKPQAELDSIWKEKCLKLEANLTEAFTTIRGLKYKVAEHEKRHRYYKLGVEGPTFYLLQFNSGILKPGIAGTRNQSKLDERLKQHRTAEPASKLLLVVCGSEALVKRIEDNLQYRYEAKRVASSHEELQNVEGDQVISTVKMILTCCARPEEWNIITEDKIKMYNDSVDETIKLRNNVMQ